jgi:hypothetical protein
MFFGVCISVIAAQTTSACSRKADVGNLTAYEKSICFVTVSVTQFNARSYCIGKGMALYNISTSDLARTEVLRNFKLWAGSATTEALIVGRSTAGCSVITKSFTTSFVKCTATRKFMCEYVQCESCGVEG